jgi:hypothetical protein
VSFITWTPPALLSKSRLWRGGIWRIVDAQYTAGGMKLVDTREEQDILDTLLQDALPALPEIFRKLDPLLAAPFRSYTLRNGSRFRASSDPGVFYGATEIDTACAEMGYWRWKFLYDAVDMPDIKPIAHTAFKSDVATLAIDLREPSFKRDEDEWQHKSSYTATQALARSARAAQLGAICYASVRDPQHGECAALLTPAAFASVTPHPVKQTWWLVVRRTEVIWRCDSRALVFSARPWQESLSLKVTLRENA